MLGSTSRPVPGNALPIAAWNCPPNASVLLMKPKFVGLRRDTVFRFYWASCSKKTGALI